MSDTQSSDLVLAKNIDCCASGGIDLSSKNRPYSGNLLQEVCFTFLIFREVAEEPLLSE